MRRIIFLILVGIFFWLPQDSIAQVLPENIDITLYPSEPKPGERVTATAVSYGMDLNSATITWVYNGATISVGTGRTSTSFTAPSSSTVATLSVTASGNGGSAQSSIVIRSASIDVIWEAIDSYTPPFYKGKALAPVGGRLRAVAVPSVTAPKTLSYTWNYNNSAVPAQSGTNKNSITIKTDVLGGNESFGVTARSGGFSGSGSISVQLRDPDVVVYQKSNGFIDYTKGSTRDVYITVPGITLRAEPYNFSISNTVENSLSIGFNIDDQSFIGTNHAQELSITNPENTGESALSINITSLKERLQFIKRSFTLRF